MSVIDNGDFSPENAAYYQFKNSGLEAIPNPATLRGNHLTWGHTPFVANAEQQDVYMQLEARISESAPISVPAIVREYVKLHFMSRFYARQDRNSLGFQEMLNPEATLSTNLETAYDDLISGECVRPYELLPIITAKGMPFGELGRLTHPWARGMEPLKEMRAAVDFAITYNDGKLCEGDDCTTYSPDGSHVRVNETSEQADVGFLVKRKRIVGKMPDDTIVIERTSFFLRVDNESGLDSDIINAIRGVATQRIELENHRLFEEPGWLDEVAKSCDLDALMVVLEENNRTDIAIPLSTTVYCYNPDRIRQVEAIRAERKLPRQVLSLNPEQYPELCAARIAGGVALRSVNLDED